MSMKFTLQHKDPASKARAGELAGLAQQVAEEKQRFKRAREALTTLEALRGSRADRQLPANFHLLVGRAGFAYCRGDGEPIRLFRR